MWSSRFRELCGQSSVRACCTSQSELVILWYVSCPGNNVLKWGLCVSSVFGVCPAALLCSQISSGLCACVCVCGCVCVDGGDCALDSFYWAHWHFGWTRPRSPLASSPASPPCAYISPALWYFPSAKLTPSSFGASLLLPCCSLFKQC